MQDQNSLHVSSKEIIAYFLIPGISQGAGFWFLSEYGFGHEGDFLFQPLMFFCAAAPTAFFLTTREGFRFKPLIFAGILGTVTSLLYFLAINSSGVPGLDPTNETIFWTCWLANLLICYISVPFFRTVFEQGKPANHYPSLFQFAWNLPVILLIAGLFNAALWIVLWLWISLFNVIDISFFEELFTEPAISWGISGGAFATAIAIARSREGIVLAMRAILFALLRILLPILALATLLFVVTALVRGPQNIDVGSWSLAGPMIWAVAIAVLLISAVAGDEGEPQHPILRWALRLQSVILPLLAGLAVWALWVRIAEYGISVRRFHAGIIVCFALAYAVIYAVSAFLPKGLAFLRQMNIVLAGAMFLTAIVIQLPMVNPWQMTADSVYNRIKSGKTKAAEIDFAYLQFELGKPGHNLLNRLEADTSLDDHELILAQIERVRASVSKWDYNRGGSDDLREATVRTAIEDGSLALLPEGTIIPDGLYSFLGQNVVGFPDVHQCLAGADCNAVLLRVEGTASPLWLLATERGRTSVALRVMWQNAVGDWQVRNLPSREFYPSKDAEAERDAFMTAFKQGDFTTGAVEIRTLTIMENDIVLLPRTVEPETLQIFVSQIPSE